MSATKIEHSHFFAFLIGCLGAFFTFSFFYVNKGSKYWQENWENHVALLGREIVGPLFSIVLERPTEPKTWYQKCTPSNLTRLVSAPSGISVSKINQWVSAYLLVVWLILMLIVSPVGNLPLIKRATATGQVGPFWLYWFTFMALLGASWMMRKRSRTDFVTHGSARKRIETIVSK